MAPRRFAPAVRVALFLAAGGRCAECSCELERGLEFLRDELAKLAAAYPQEAERLRITASLEALDERLSAAMRER